MRTHASRIGLALVASLAGVAQADLVEGTFLFESLSVNGDTVQGTFAFDSSDPSTLTGFTISWLGESNFGDYDFLNNTNPFIEEITIDRLPEYGDLGHGEGLYGSFDGVALLSGDLPIVWGATFSGQTATIAVTSDNFQYDFVSGRVSYTVTPAPGAAGVIALGGLLTSRRRRR